MNKSFTLLTLAAVLCTTTSIAVGQQAFKTSDAAAGALASAAKAGDPKAIVTVLGPNGEDIVSSGDEVADAATREKFVAAYDAKHAITMDGENKAIMTIGQQDFPLPIPIVRSGGMWRFDTDAGREEFPALPLPPFPPLLPEVPEPEPPLPPLLLAQPAPGPAKTSAATATAASILVLICTIRLQISC